MKDMKRFYFRQCFLRNKSTGCICKIKLDSNELETYLALGWEEIAEEEFNKAMEAY